MEKIVFFIIAIVTLIWAIWWIFNYKLSIGHKTQIIPIILLWIMLIYFHDHPETSKYHMLWVSPSIIFGEMIISVIVAQVIMKIKNNMR